MATLPIRHNIDARGPWTTDVRRAMMDQQSGYSNLFYVMLIVGIIGVVGFFVVAAGAAAGGI